MAILLIGAWAFIWFAVVIGVVGALAWTAWEAYKAKDASLLVLLPLGALIWVWERLPEVPAQWWIAFAVFMWVEWRFARLHEAIHAVAAAVTDLRERGAATERQDSDEDVEI